jgi:hypothetical protein
MVKKARRDFTKRGRVLVPMGLSTYEDVRVPKPVTSFQNVDVLAFSRTK